MNIVAVNNKFQVVIPRHVRELAHIAAGDLLEAGVEDGRIVFTPKSMADRHIAEGLEDVRDGRTHGPYSTVRDAVAALEARARRRAKTRNP
jgi:AbrB family looped-hinge helix DNA binding protein